jgi:hypothetical protein
MTYLVKRGMANLPNGYQIKAGRCLIGMNQRELARAADLDVVTVLRMEQAGFGYVKARGANLQKVIEALRAHGVEITEDGVRLISKKPHR